MKNQNTKLFGIATISLLALILVIGGALYGQQMALATTDAPDYAIVLPGQDAPLYGRAAPYGQYIVTHNSASITTTENLGTVARTNGYGDLKAIFCDTGTYEVSGNVHGRVTSSGGVYTISTGLTFAADTNTYITLTWLSPWTSLALTSEVTGSTTSCGIYVQTP